MSDTENPVSNATTKDETLQLTVKTESDKKHSLSIKNCSNNTILIKTASPFSTEIENLVSNDGADEIQFYTDWDHIWHNVGMTNSDDGIWNLKRYNSIYNAGIVRKSDAKGVAVTFETPNNFGSSINFTDGKIFAFEYVDKEIKVGESITIDTFKISDYQHFGKALTSLHGKKKSRKDIKDIRNYFGYNTWESYHELITPEDIYENLEVIKSKPLFKENIKYFQSSIRNISVTIISKPNIHYNKLWFINSTG